MKVYVYKNLTKKCWSMKAREGDNYNLVTGHAHHIIIANPIFKVSESGRKRVNAEKCKNVHAGVIGSLIAVGSDSQAFYNAELPVTDSAFDLTLYNGKLFEVSYNPYKYDFFYRREDKSPIHEAFVAIFTFNSLFVY